MPLLPRSMLPTPVVHTDVPGSSRVHVPGAYTACCVALACALHRRVSSMSTLTAFASLCVLVDPSFDLPEFTGDGADAARTRARSHEVEGRDRGLAADASRGPCCAEAFSRPCGAGYEWRRMNHKKVANVTV